MANYQPEFPLQLQPGSRENISGAMTKIKKEIERIYRLLNDGDASGDINDINDKIDDIIDGTTKVGKAKEADVALKTKGTLTIERNGTSLGSFNGSADKTINFDLVSTLLDGLMPKLPGDKDKAFCGDGAWRTIDDILALDGNNGGAGYVTLANGIMIQKCSAYGKGNGTVTLNLTWPKPFPGKCILVAGWSKLDHNNSFRIAEGLFIPFPYVKPSNAPSDSNGNANFNTVSLSMVPRWEQTNTGAMLNLTETRLVQQSTPFKCWLDVFAIGW